MDLIQLGRNKLCRRKETSGQTRETNQQTFCINITANMEPNKVHERQTFIVKRAFEN